MATCARQQNLILILLSACELLAKLSIKITIEIKHKIINMDESIILNVNSMISIEAMFL